MERAAEGWGGVEGVTVFVCFSVQCGFLILKFDALLDFEGSENGMMECQKRNYVV